MKRIVFILAVLFCMTVLANAEAFKVGIVLSTGGLGDNSFNDSAFRGLTQAKEKLGIQFSYMEPKTEADMEKFLEQYAQSKYDLVIATGFTMAKSCENVAKKYPNIKFAIIDEKINLPNVSSLTFKEHEGSFLVGAIAGLTTKTNTIGFVGAIEAPLIKKFEAGYIQGAKYVNKNVTVASKYMQNSKNPFNDPIMGKQIAYFLVSKKADIIYHAAGGTGIGVIEGARDKGIFAIGVDSNQDKLAPGFVLTSMMKNVDTAVFKTIEKSQKGNFKSGLVEFGIADGGVGTTDFQFTKDKLPAGALAKLKELQEKIVSGEIKVKETVEK